LSHFCRAVIGDATAGPSHCPPPITLLCLLDPGSYWVLQLPKLPVSLKCSLSKDIAKVSPESSASLERSELVVGADVWWQWRQSHPKEVRAG